MELVDDYCMKFLVTFGGFGTCNINLVVVFLWFVWHFDSLSPLFFPLYNMIPTQIDSVANVS